MVKCQMDMGMHRRGESRPAGSCYWIYSTDAGIRSGCTATEMNTLDTQIWHFLNDSDGSCLGEVRQHIRQVSAGTAALGNLSIGECSRLLSLVSRPLPPICCWRLPSPPTVALAGRRRPRIHHASVGGCRSLAATRQAQPCAVAGSGDDNGSVAFLALRRRRCGLQWGDVSFEPPSRRNHGTSVCNHGACVGNMMQAW